MSEALMVRRSSDFNTTTWDDEVAARATSQLRQSGYSALRQVRCSFSHGVLRLEGTLSSFYMRQVAESLVAGMPEVSEVESRLGVSPQ